MSYRSSYFILFLAVLLSLAACDKLIYDQPDDNAGNGAKVYLSVSTRAAHAKSGLRSSINEDNADSFFEDRVHSLAMVIFDTATGAKIGEYFNANLGSGVATPAFNVELTPGQRDFYFVANMPGMETDLAAIPNRDAMDVYLSDASRVMNELLYLGASETVGFPMARVYLNQGVTEGGTVYQPKPFKPRQYDEEERQVVVNAAGNGAVEREYVELIRVVAKLEVKLDGGSNLGVDKVYFRNANGHFRLIEFETAPTTYFNDNTSNTELRQLTGTGTYMYYMPEALITSATWSDTGNNQPINYFTIETNSGETYNIPIISNETSITTDYLAKATGNFIGFTPQYTIHRNDHYKYVIRNLEKIEIIYIVNPWELVNKALYMGYGYNVEVEGTKVSINNTVEACDPYHVRLETVGSITFSDGDTQKDFADYDPDASISFELSEEPPVGYGDYLKVYFIDIDTATDTPVHTFSK